MTRRNRRRYYNDGNNAVLWIALVLFVLGMFSSIYINYGTQDTFEAKVLSTDIKRVGSGDDAKDKYLVSLQKVDGTLETVEIDDTLFWGNFTSADVYFEMKNNVGATYKFTVVGFRVGFLSYFRNIVRYEKATE